jgi:simple sugar transport system ATP-binding protein
LIERSGAPALELVQITKRYGAVTACDRADLAVYRGEILGLLGQNGAGKSTLMKIVLGLVQPDAGDIQVDGAPVRVDDPVAAAVLGIAMVHQHLSVIDALTVWENVHLGERVPLDVRKIRSDVGDIADRYGLDIDPDARVGDLTAGQRQRVEIIKCLRRDPAVMILDEPTSVLTLAESDALFGVLRHVVQAEGKAVVLISHKLDEILNGTDRVVVMRDGSVVEELETSIADASQLATAMVGRQVSLRSEASALGLLESLTNNRERKASTEADREIALRIDSAVVVAKGGNRLLDELSLDVLAGEIVGIIGVEGNGQSTLSELMSSLIGLDGGSVEVNGVKVAAGKPGVMCAAGIGVIPEDRHDAGCVLDLSLAENIILSNPRQVASRGVINRSERDALAQELIDRFEISAQSPSVLFRTLSGGNQQRAVLARELAAAPSVLVAVQPTTGLDVGAIEYMSEQIRVAAADGMGVLVVSTELEEVLDLADRIAVIYRGRIIGEMARGDVDLERIGLLMGGRNE